MGFGGGEEALERGGAVGKLIQRCGDVLAHIGDAGRRHFFDEFVAGGVVVDGLRANLGSACAFGQAQTGVTLSREHLRSGIEDSGFGEYGFGVLGPTRVRGDGLPPLRLATRSS